MNCHFASPFYNKTTLLFLIQLFTEKRFKCNFFLQKLLSINLFILNGNDLIVFKWTGWTESSVSRCQSWGFKRGAAHQREPGASRNASHGRPRRRTPRPRISAQECFGGFIRTPGSAVWAEGSWAAGHVLWLRDPVSTLKCSAGEAKAQQVQLRHGSLLQNCTPEAAKS